MNTDIIYFIAQVGINYVKFSQASWFFFFFKIWPISPSSLKFLVKTNKISFLVLKYRLTCFYFPIATNKFISQTCSQVVLSNKYDQVNYKSNPLSRMLQWLPVCSGYNSLSITGLVYKVLDYKTLVPFFIHRPFS